ncbi:hypothetical protein MLD38_000660 [Melastoma candidum]|uniref:Uncharacterized protein n=1 Tax=Melastoma candidum TaxID=119954 RepID=A0ACB9SC30_9MYRT|nr:hypothetical protein MLD38_000660 [Melastoma candidum]
MDQITPLGWMDGSSSPSAGTPTPSPIVYLPITDKSSHHHITLRKRIIFRPGNLSSCWLGIQDHLPRDKMLEGKAVVGETDMRQAMQQYALDLASKALDCFDVTESTDIARFIKKEFDRAYGPGWQCIVGTDFGSFVTHHYGCFIYFCVGSLAILLFKGSAIADEEPKQFPKLGAVRG